MQTSQYQKGKFYTLPIQCIKVEGKSSFFIVLDGNGREHAIKMFDFQRTDAKSQNLSELFCMVKDVHGDEVVFVQNIAEMTKSIYPNGRTYPFTVTRVTPSINQGFSYYDLWNENGVPFRLRSKEKLRPQQKIECKITRPYANKILLELTDAKSAVVVQNFKSLHEILSGCEINDSFAHLFELYFAKLSIFDEARDYYRKRNPEWAIIALRSVPEIEDWGWIDATVVQDLLSAYRKICLYIIEDSDYLQQFPSFEKGKYQKALEEKVEMTEIGAKCFDLISNDKHKEEVDRIFQKINLSGHLYNAKEKVNLLIFILMLEPQILEEKIDDILNIIGKQDISRWDNYMTGLFYSLLEVYINRNRSRTNRLATVENDQSVQLLNKMIRAISYRILLASQYEDKDEEGQLLKAMLFHYLAFIRGKDALGNTRKTFELSESLIERAFTTLLAPEEDIHELTWNRDYTQTELLAYQLSLSTPSEITFATKTFNSENARFSVSPNGIILSRILSSDKDKNVLPEGFLSWHNIQIFLDSSVKHKIDKNSKFKTWCKFWDNVEADLLAPKESVAKPTFKKRLPDVGEETTIRVLYRDSSTDHPNRFYCKIEHPEHEGYGWIDAYQKGGSIGLFHYNPELGIESFYNEDGKQLLLNVRVNSLSSPNDEVQTCTFDAIGKIDNCVRENVGFGAEFDSKIILEATDRKGTFLAITDAGFGVFISQDGASDPDISFGLNDTVRVRIDNASNPSKIQGIVIGAANDDVSIKTAAESLLLTYCDDQFYEETPEELEEETMTVAEEQFEEDSIREIINIFAHKSVLEENYIIAYSYLAIARILSRMIDSEDLKRYIDLNKKALILREEYKENGKVDENDVEELLQDYADMADCAPYPMQRIAEIRLVNWFGRQEKNDVLWGIINNQETNLILKKLARLVLSFNLSDGFGFQNQQNIISSKMKSLLNINVEMPNILSFGEEDQLTEFKTSIVYPPENHMKADRDLQTYNIMKVICGMANAYGGTLYLGVNNTGAPTGLVEDLKFFDNSKDKFDLYVRNKIRFAFGNELNAAIAIEYPEAGGHLVYAIKIPASKTPVKLSTDNQYIYFLREGTSTYAIDLEELTHTMDNRNFSLYNVQAQGISAEDIKQEKVEPKVAQKATTAKKKIEAEISTSLIRRNITNQWEDGYGEDTVAYLRIYAGNKWCLLDDVDFEDGLLTLAIHEDEKDGYLIVVGNDGKVNKIPMMQLLRKERNENFNASGENPFFVCPMRKDAALLSVLDYDKGKRFMRIDTLGELCEGAPTAAGNTLTDVEFSNVCYCDIINAEHLEKFQRWCDLGRKTIGLQLKDVYGEKAKKEFEKIGIDTNRF